MKAAASEQKINSGMDESVQAQVSGLSSHFCGVVRMFEEVLLTKTFRNFMRTSLKLV